VSNESIRRWVLKFGPLMRPHKFEASAVRFLVAWLSMCQCRFNAWPGVGPGFWPLALGLQNMRRPARRRPRARLWWPCHIAK
jgi:hypothetical protein